VSINQELKLPFYAKATIFLIGLLALLTIVYIAQAIVVPIIFATIIAIVLHPLVTFLRRLRINRVLAIVIVIIIAFLVIAAFGTLLFSQASRFSESWPILVDKFIRILHQTTTWASGYFNISPEKLHEWITKTKVELFDTSSIGIGKTLMSIGSTAAIMLLVPVYIFMLLFYQPLLLEFIRRIFGAGNTLDVNEIISQTKTLVQRYIIGLLVEAVIVAALYSAGLLMIGIDYALLLGFIAALLNIVPYIGGLIALSLIMIVTITTKGSVTYPLLVAALSIFIHFIDNSYIIPKIVASKVKINALVSITSIIAASALLGVPGMIICIPVIGIVKLVFDRIEPFKPWGFLFGDTMPPLLGVQPFFKSKLRL
jgi:predicted PurR-regulated permease PerM